ncbi:hypothetical protein O4J56_06430 [Nocardiopsis sp. RSe5-2]|uniref:Uncharacterized protein n=1 Tax=Nocardiopsis endophytica TaxID=3018445 RepID=A0ABT4U016_9ACTN|nr:hypothetical protein [Nocardiopsis endophytica]MDA2810271.1 hypothetical protein [Nocardiopsis endophytica]
MPRYDRLVEEFLDFLLTRMSEEEDLLFLITHEPRRMYAAYLETGGGRCETRGVDFTGCGVCSRIPPYTLFADYVHINVPAWPCPAVRALALRFADHADFRDNWRPESALFASGRPVH